MSDQKPVPIGPRGPGRPRIEERSSSVSVWLPVSAHDRLVQLAKQQEQSISKTVRQLLALRLR